MFRDTLSCGFAAEVFSETLIEAVHCECDGPGDNVFGDHFFVAELAD